MKNLQIILFFVIVIFNVSAQKQHDFYVLGGVNYALYTVQYQSNATFFPVNEQSRPSFAGSLNYAFKPKFGKLSYHAKIGVDNLLFTNKFSFSAGRQTLLVSRYSIFGGSVMYELNKKFRPFVGLDVNGFLSIRDKATRIGKMFNIPQPGASLNERLILPKLGIATQFKKVSLQADFRFGLGNFKEFESNNELTTWKIMPLNLSVGYHF